jgi:hypothetical protein
MHCHPGFCLGDIKNKKQFLSCNRKGFNRKGKGNKKTIMGVERVWGRNPEMRRNSVRN